VVSYYTSKVLGKAKAEELLLTLLVDVQVIDIGHELTISALHSKIEDSEWARMWMIRVNSF
jgi:hypothetical protein